MAKFCTNCGKELNEQQDVCLNCGVKVNKEISNGKEGKSTGKAVTQLVLTIIGFITFIFIVGIFITAAVGIWAFIEAIMIFTGGISKDANGNELIN